MHLGIEIGGTKLQLGVGSGAGGPLVVLERFDVDPARGAAGILETMEAAGSRLAQRYQLKSIGVGFGGPVRADQGIVLKSHQIEGWTEFPLVAWCGKVFGLPAYLGNDCDIACLAEARFGAGKGRSVVFYVTIGSGLGGGLVIDGQIYRGNGVAAAEIGHLRPGPSADRPEETVESIASGWGIAALAQARLAEPMTHQLKPLQDGLRKRRPEDVRQRLIEVEEVAEEFAADLLGRADGKIDQVSAKLVGQAAADGNEVAIEVLSHACQALGWGIAQMITLLSPHVIVIGGGVAQMGEALLLAPLREQVDRYVFPPLRGTFSLVPAELGEAVVVHGAVALAAGEGVAFC